MKIQPKNIVITVCVIVITPFVWTLLFSNNGRLRLYTGLYTVYSHSSVTCDRASPVQG